MHDFFGHQTSLIRIFTYVVCYLTGDTHKTFISNIQERRQFQLGACLGRL